MEDLKDKPVCNVCDLVHLDDVECDTKSDWYKQRLEVINCNHPTSRLLYHDKIAWDENGRSHECNLEVCTDCMRTTKLCDEYAQHKDGGHESYIQ